MSNPDHTRRTFVSVTGAAGLAALAGCLGGDEPAEDAMTDGMTDDGMTDDDDMATEEEMMESEAADPASAPRPTIDRFSEDAGTLMVRTEENGLPGPGEAIDFDQAPFVTRGLGPGGEPVEYYNFDVQTTAPAPIYVLFHEGEDTPVEGQLNVVGVVPGDDGYNDFWQVHRVTVPEDYTANTITSAAAVMDGDYDVEATDMLVNCPIVPEGSTATKRAGDGDTGLVQGWYDGQVVHYFTFVEASLTVTDGSVPLSPIFVSFNANPGQDGGGPASGFMTEMGSSQTHNVVATLPGDDGYSPLWQVAVYDNADFDAVMDLESASEANILNNDAATVNCPIVSTGMTS
ncbi:hypothetical protein [Haloarchaeobius iranensis]|uniref:Uncharacterized protein n=1 Tax=Haloarchaeobius iranensis TaxID=996166 RepID=A0A1G9Z737_9EURY|nr:hypothetical protein [Haloarchaeobius iranensis]SDN16937.1 hypothetical protein SAMN05192554_11848 [Haloarchaeobius iranensis]